MTEIDSGEAARRGNAAQEERKPRLLEQVKQRLHYKHYSLRTEKSYVHWIKRFTMHQILVGGGKGAKDRVTMLPAALVEPLKAHLPLGS